MPGRHDIDFDDSNPPENIMPAKDTGQSNFHVNELFNTPNLPSKEAKEVEGSGNIHSVQAFADHVHSKRLDIRQSPDKNTYVLRGPTTVRKSYWMTKSKSYASKPLLIGSIHEGSFRFGDCPN